MDSERPGSLLRDPFIRTGTLAVHVGYVLAILSGGAKLAGVGPAGVALPVHVGAGALLLFGSLTIYLRTKTLEHESSRPAGIVLLALLVGAVNGLLALVGASSWPVHLAIMLLALFAGESVRKRLKRAG